MKKPHQKSKAATAYLESLKPKDDDGFEWTSDDERRELQHYSEDRFQRNDRKRSLEQVKRKRKTKT